MYNIWDIKSFEVVGH